MKANRQERRPCSLFQQTVFYMGHQHEAEHFHCPTQSSHQSAVNKVSLFHPLPPLFPVLFRIIICGWHTFLQMLKGNVQWRASVNMFAATKFVLCTSLLDSLHWEEYFFNVLKYNTSLYRVNQQLAACNCQAFCSPPCSVSVFHSFPVLCPPWNSPFS